MDWEHPVSRRRFLFSFLTFDFVSYIYCCSNVTFDIPGYDPCSAVAYSRSVCPMWTVISAQESDSVSVVTRFEEYLFARLRFLTGIQTRFFVTWLIPAVSVLVVSLTSKWYSVGKTPHPGNREGGGLITTCSYSLLSLKFLRGFALHIATNRMYLGLTYES